MTKNNKNNQHDSTKKPFYHKKTFKVLFQISMTLIIFFAEAITGYYTNCMALISDSFHTLSDVISLCIGLAAIRAAHKTVGAYSRKTFGNNRAEVLGGIIQAVFLYALCFNIYIEALKRFITPEKQSDVHMILVVGGIGLVVNLMGMFLFMDDGEHGHGHSHGLGHGHSHSHGGKKKEIKDVEKNQEEKDTLILPSMPHRPSTITEPMMSNFSLVENGHIVEQNTVTKPKGNMNTRGIFLHIMGDTLGSVAVMASAGLLYFYQKTVAMVEDSEGNWIEAKDFTCDENFQILEPQNNNSTTEIICKELPDYDGHTWLYYVDPFLTFLIATIISCSTWPLFKESTRILMEHCPEDVDLEQFQQKLEKAVKIKAKCDTVVEIPKIPKSNNNNKVNENSTTTTFTEEEQEQELELSNSHKAVVHDLHIWQLNPQNRAATVHIVIEKCCGEPNDDSINKYIDLVKILKAEFEKIDVTNLTIQPEFISPMKEENCDNCDCEGETPTVDIEDLGKPPKNVNKTESKPRRKRSGGKKPPKDVSYYP